MPEQSTFPGPPHSEGFESDADTAEDELLAGDVLDEALDATEEEHAADEARQERDDLGVFDQQDYAERIKGWEFKSERREVDEDPIEVYYRRPWDAPGGTKWERIGHQRSPNALDLKRLLYCYRKHSERRRAATARRELIESVFGPGAEAVVDSLLAARSGKAGAGPLLTPRQEAFCRSFLTEPNATRAAILAGYGEAGAAVEGHRMLRNAKILARITTLRREKGLSYCFDRDSLLDRLELVFGEAMEGRDYATAIRALLAQAQMFGIGAKRHAATERAEAKARVEIAEARPIPPDGTEP